MLSKANRSGVESLSARRVWIEIPKYATLCDMMESLSARRVWIEIPDRLHRQRWETVTLREEGVD